MPQFDVATYSSQIFWLVVVFGVIYYIMSKIIVPSAERIFTTRNDFLAEYVESANSLAEHTAKLNADREQALKQIKYAVEQIKQECIQQSETLLAEKQKILVRESQQQAALASEELIQISESFKQTKDDLCKSLAALVIMKLIQQSPRDLQLLNQCYKKIR
jgi:F-type H+-transporting ATPase subunit b